MLLDFKHVIHLLLIAESVLFAFQLLTYKNLTSKSSHILGYQMIFLALFFTSSFVFTAKILHLAVYSQYIMMLVFLLLNPMYFLYVKYLTIPDYKFNSKFLLHFIPAICLSLFNIIFFSLLSYDEKILFLSGNTVAWKDIPTFLKINTLIYFLSLIIYYSQLVVYILKMILLLKKHRKNIDDFFSYEKEISLNWIKIFIVILSTNAILEISISFAYYYNLFKVLETAYYIVLFFMINFLGYFGLKQTDIYIGKKQKKPPDFSKEFIADTSKAEETVFQEKVSFELSEEEQLKIIEKIEEAMVREKLYYNHLLSIYDLAEHLNTNKTYISYAINRQLGKNFRTFVNEFRVNEAIRLFSDPAYNKYTLEGIAQIVGYTSKSNFNDTFKKSTGETPSAYREKLSTKFHNKG